jgi:hypothetical protein
VLAKADIGRWLNGEGGTELRSAGSWPH